MSSFLPIIDLSDSYSDDPQAALAAASAIDAVCRRHGFFYVTGHGIPQALIDRAFAASAQFFSLAETQKLECHVSRSPLRRGYEAIAHQSLDNGKPADLMEGYTVGLDVPPGVPAGSARRGPNQWPPETAVPALQATAENYLQAMEGLARHLMGLLALGLGLPRDYFGSAMRLPEPSIRLLHYPPHPAAADPQQMGCGAHTDWGALTLLAQDTNGGLQVSDADGWWHDVPPVPGSLVVNLGDMMARWTNDAYRSTVHRVINRVSGQDRYSIPYFFNIDPDSVVSALPGCHDSANPPRYPPVTAGEHLREKLRLARAAYA